jgi:hypothetical protein
MSIFCTLAMMLSMAVVAHADEANYTEWKLISKEGGNAVVELHLVTNDNVTACPMFWDFSDAIAKGATGIELTKVEASLSNYITQNGMNCVMFNKTSVDGFTGDIVLGTATVKGITENFEIKLQPTSSKTNTKITDADKAVVTTDFTFATQTIVLKEEAEKPATTEVVEKDAIFNPETAKTVGVKATTIEGITFNKLSVILNNGEKDVEVELYNDETAIDAVTVFGLNIMQVPTDVTITVADVVAE